VAELWPLDFETFASLLNIHGGDICVVPTHLVFVLLFNYVVFRDFYERSIVYLYEHGVIKWVFLFFSHSFLTIIELLVDFG